MGLRWILTPLISLLWSTIASANVGGSYHPPLPLLSAAPPPVQGSSSYQPPIALARSVSHSPHAEAPPSYSVLYTPPANDRHREFQHALPTAYQQPADSASLLAKSLPTSYSGGAYRQQATSYSVHQQPQAPQQAIHKAPASEIHSEKSPLAKDKDNKNDEYVVYYYYYYDNDTATGANGANNANNLSLSFDDIPSLESYDADAAKTARQLEPEKSANDIAKTDAGPSSQGRSVSGTPPRSEETLVQPLRPVPNVFRYGSNEVPRFPVLPNFVVSQPHPSPEPSSEEPPPTAVPSPSPVEIEDDELANHVLDSSDGFHQTNPPPTTTETTTTTTTTTTEAPPTDPPTTTERPRRRLPSGGRRRFSPSPSARPRPQTTPASTSSSTSSSTSEPSTRSSQSGGRFQGNRLRPRPSSGFGRSRTAYRSTEEPDSSNSESTSPSSTTPSSRGRFSTSQAPRRFQSSRSRSTSSTISTTSTSSTTRAPFRSRPTSRPRPNLISRNRPPRPGFLRPRPEPETTPSPTEPTEASSGEESDPTEVDDDGEEIEEEELDKEEEEPETEAPPTTTEANRLSALFRPRNRANRPRPPLIGNRPPRS